jgi:hypothetical protein
VFRRAVLTAFVTLLSGASAAQEYPPAFPRTNATKLLETDHIVVWDIVWPKGEPSPLHRHVYDQVGTYYQAGGRTITSLDGSKRSSTTAVGAISTTRRGTTHIEEGATDPPLRAVFIELKKDDPVGSASAQSVKPDAQSLPAGLRLVHEEPRVTVWEAAWTPGAKIEVPRLSRDAIWVWLTPGTVRITKAGTPPVASKVVAGEFRRLMQGTVETTEALDGTPRAMIFRLN